MVRLVAIHLDIVIELRPIETETVYIFTFGKDKIIFDIETILVRERALYLATLGNKIIGFSRGNILLLDYRFDIVNFGVRFFANNINTIVCNRR